MPIKKKPPTKKRVAKKKPAQTEWSSGRTKSFITSVLRGGFRKFPAKYTCLKDAYVGKQLNKATKRMADHYKCASCSECFPQKEVQVDHIVPIIGAKGFTTWDDFIAGLYCDKSNLQVLCTECHKLKSQLENEERVKARKDG